MSNPRVGIIMGSDSDLDIMSQAAKTLEEFGVANEVRVVSAHRTPEEMIKYARDAAGAHPRLSRAWPLCVQR